MKESAPLNVLHSTLANYKQYFRTLIMSKLHYNVHHRGTHREMSFHLLPNIKYANRNTGLDHN